MVTSPADSPVTDEYKLCPTCGYANLAYRNRCYHCWNDIAGARPIPQAEAEQRLALEERIESQRLARETQRKLWARRIRLVGVAMAVLLFAWWGYRTFIYEPPPVPTPSSTERHLTSNADTWPISGGDLGATRRTEATVALEAPEAWNVDLGAGPATPAISDGERIYETLLDGRIVALDVQTGAEVWTHRLQNFPFAAPTVAGDRLYVPLRQGILYVVDASTGEFVGQSAATQSSFGTSPLVADGMVYVFGTGELHGFDAETLERLWTVSIPSNWAFVTPALSDRYIAVATGNRTLAFDRVTGRETYFYEFERAHPYSIAIDDGDVYTISPRFGAALDLESRRPWWEGIRAVWNQFWLWGMAPDVPPPPSLWVIPEPPSQGLPIAIADDRLVLASADGDLRAIDRANGEDVWRIDTEAIVQGPLVTPAGVLAVHPDRLVRYDLADGAVLAERPFEGTSLFDAVVTARGTFVTTSAGTVIALR
ncbi:MAG: PQQ-binding-like beta-propeller repeat protein [Dehalococcoidia bacterium]